MPCCRIRRSPRSARQIGAGGGDYHAQRRPRVHRAEAARPARRQRRPGDRAAAHQPRQDPGHHALHAGGAGHHHRRAAVQDPVSVHADRRRSRRAQPLGGAVPRQAQGDSRHHRRRHRPAECRPAARHHDQARGRLELRHPALDDRQHARRRLRPAHRLDHVHDAATSTTSFWRSSRKFQYGPEALNDIYVNSSSGQQVPLSHAGRQRREGGAARGQPSGPVPVGDDLVQSRAGHRDRPGGQRHPAGRERARQAALAADQLPGQRAGLPVRRCRARRS